MLVIVVVLVLVIGVRMRRDEGVKGWMMSGGWVGEGEEVYIGAPGCPGCAVYSGTAGLRRSMYALRSLYVLSRMIYLRLGGDHGVYILT